MNALINHLVEVLRDTRHAALRHWEKRLHGTVERSFEDADEKQEASPIVRVLASAKSNQARRSDARSSGQRRDEDHPTTIDRFARVDDAKMMVLSNRYRSRLGSLDWC
jgi:hypothetical protein